MVIQQQVMINPNQMFFGMSEELLQLLQEYLF